MTNIVFSEKCVVTSDFSPVEMSRISAVESRSAGRKYFITKYVIPLALSAWYQKSDTEVRLNHNCIVHIIRVMDNFMVHLSFGEARQVQSTSVTAAVAYTALDGIAEQVFNVCPPDLWKGPSRASLGNALAVAFEECFPEQLAATPQTLADCPVVAGLLRKDDGETSAVEVNVMVKTRGSVKDQSLLLNQADREDSILCTKPSKKYKKMYNVITGAWIGNCDRNDPEICDQCKAIYSSPAANNAYDDPDLT